MKTIIKLYNNDGMCILEYPVEGVATIKSLDIEEMKREHPETTEIQITYILKK